MGKYVNPETNIYPITSGVSQANFLGMMLYLVNTARLVKIKTSSTFFRQVCGYTLWHIKANASKSTYITSSLKRHSYPLTKINDQDFPQKRVS